MVAKCNFCLDICIYLTLKIPVTSPSKAGIFRTAMARWTMAPPPLSARAMQSSSACRSINPRCYIFWFGNTIGLFNSLRTGKSPFYSLANYHVYHRTKWAIFHSHVTNNKQRVTRLYCSYMSVNFGLDCVQKKWISWLGSSSSRWLDWHRWS